MKVLVLGSKEYPMGTNKGDDPRPSGGIEVYIDQLLPRLADEDLNFIVITRRFNDTPGYEKQDHIEVHRVGWIKGFYFRNISFNIMSFFKALTLDFDLIFAQDLFATFLGVILSRLKNKPLVSVFHGVSSHQPQYHFPLGHLLRSLENFSFRRADYIVFLSDSKGFLEDVTKSAVIPLGVEIYDTDPILAKNDLSLDDDRIVITFVGRLIKVKGIPYLLEALSTIETDYICLIAGSGPEEEELIKLSNKLGLNNKVRFLGYREDIPTILEATDIFVLPSLSEGLSISLLQAKAAGCPCIVTDIGLPVVHEGTAIIVRPKDPGALAEAIKLLMRDERLRKKIGLNAKDDAFKNYRWEKIIQDYKKLFQRFDQNV